MASFTLKIIMNIMKKRNENFAIGPGTDYAAERIRLASPKNQLPPAKGVTFTSDTLGGVPVELSTPKKVAGDAIIFYIHGGGYIYGDATTSRGYASVLADEIGLRVVSISYRLGPEHKFPAGPDDCFSVYTALVEKYPKSKIALVGESGGGTFVLVVSLMAKDKKIRLPACICAWSPCTNLAENLPSRKKNVKTDLVVPFENLNDLLREVYLDGKTDPRNPYVSPLFGDYQGFPPLKITADSGEVLFDDSELLVKKAKTAGVEVEYQVFSGTFHSFPTIGRSCPESKQILKETAAYIHKHCDA